MTLVYYGRTIHNYKTHSTNLQNPRFLRSFGSYLPRTPNVTYKKRRAILCLSASRCPEQPAGTSRDWFECITPDNQVFCYYVTETKGTHNEQKQECKALHTQADFAVLNTKQMHLDCVSANNVTIGKYPLFYIGY